MPTGLRRFHQTGQTHFVTFSCYRRRPRFDHAAAYELFLHCLEDMRSRFAIRIYGYVVMPEHVHILLSEPKRGSLADAIHYLKLAFSKRHRRRPSGAFWQKRYHDRNVRGANEFSVQDALFEDVLIHISRLMDPLRSAGKSNLTLRRLPPLVAGQLRNNVNKLLGECETKCAFARDWRMRRIAHNDLELALDDPRAVPLAHASRRTVKDALDSIAVLLNAVEMHYKKSTVMYELHPLGNAESLLHALEERFKAHEITPFSP